MKTHSLLEVFEIPMVDCKRCGRDIDDPKTTTCSKTLVAYKDGEYLPRVLYEGDAAERCSVCNIMPGGVHHEDCYMERCPKCGQRLVSCGCEKG
jgi:hypothetical protein